VTELCSAVSRLLTVAEAQWTISKTTRRVSAKQMKWTSSLASFSQVTRPAVDVLEQSARSVQADGLLDVIGNPFSGKLPLTRRSRDETGVPLLRDIALSHRTPSTISGFPKHVVRNWIVPTC
jgi:hypothetical protein